LGIAAQVTKVVNRKPFPNCKFSFSAMNEVNYLVGFVFHELEIHGTTLEHRFEPPWFIAYY